MAAERVQVRKAVSMRSHSPPRKRARRETALLRTSRQRRQTSHSVVLVFLCCCLRRRRYSWRRRCLCRTPYRPRPRPRGRSRTPRFQGRQRGLLWMSAQEAEGPSRRNRAVRPSALDAAVTVRDRQKRDIVTKEMRQRPLCPVKAMSWICVRRPGGNELPICLNRLVYGL